MFGSFEILAGDFQKSKNAQFAGGSFHLPVDGKFLREKIPSGQVEDLDVASEENVKRMAGSIGWGVVGGLALGGIGVIAGLLAGGTKKEVTFVCKFKDGRRMLARADNKTFTEIKASQF